MKPIYVHYFDKDGACVYNLTRGQFRKLLDEDNGIELADKFLVEEEYTEGYIPTEVAVLAKLYGFEVGTE